MIAPNPESALNEEAGKLLLEAYDEYFSRAKLYTEIHARNSSKSSQYDTAQASSTTSSLSITMTNPLDSNKTIQATCNNQTSSSNQSSDEPNIKMSKLNTNVQTNKKVDKKKALKRL